MTAEQHIFRPDYALSPGAQLGECLGIMGISARELARRCGRSAKLMVEILSGKASVEPETAIQLELVTDVDATIWLTLEAQYRLHLARAEDDNRRTADFEWASRFPLPELRERGWLGPYKDKADTARKLLQFFGVAGVDACEEYFNSLAVSFRHSPSFDSDRHALFAWLRIGELEADKIACADYDRTAFVGALDKIRAFSLKPVEDFIPAIVQCCAEAGVAFIVQKPFRGMALSGISRWLNPRKALIQQTMRHMANDHFWFTFFHEAAHILHHSRKTVFVEGRKENASTSEEEREANRWATEFLIPPKLLSEFVEEGDFSASAIREFANELGIAPGIIVGQLQNRGLLAYSKLNGLKDRFGWK